MRFFFKASLEVYLGLASKFHIDFVKPSQFSKNKSKTSFELHLVLPNKFLKGHENVKLSSLADAAQIMPVWLGCLAGRFYGLKSRISKKKYSEPLKHTLLPCKVPLKAFSILFKGHWACCDKEYSSFPSPIYF